MALLEVLLLVAVLAAVLPWLAVAFLRRRRSSSPPAAPAGPAPSWTPGRIIWWCFLAGLGLLLVWWWLTDVEAKCYTYQYLHDWRGYVCVR